MPSSRAERIWRWVQALLAPFGPGLTGTAVVLGHVALALLIGTGEVIRWVDYRDTLIAAPMLRAAHVLAGYVLIAALVVRLGSAAMDWLERVTAHGVRRAHPAFHWQDRFTAAGLLDAAWWLVIAGLVLSGLERYAQLRQGTSLLPVLPPAAWWALHRPLLPYLYAILLINLVIRGRMIVRRALSYLYTP